MKKPTGTFRCLACGEKWDGSDLHLDSGLTAVKWTCGDLFCGGSVVESKEPVIKSMADGRYELHCPVCGESVIPPLPCPVDVFTGYIKRFQAAHKHDGRETAVSERAT